MIDDTPELWINALGMKFRLVQPGAFQMGSPKTESRRFADESARSVVISTRFYLSLYPTTQAEWRAVSGGNPSKYSDSKKAPVESVSWLDCASFIEAINSPEFSKKISDPIWHSRLILHKKNFFCNFKMRNFFYIFTFCIQPNKKARFGYAILLR